MLKCPCQIGSGTLVYKWEESNINDPFELGLIEILMAHALYRSTFLENWGSDIHRIIEACQEQGVEEPTWRWDGAFVYVTFKRSVKGTSDTAKDNLGGNDALSIPQVSPKCPPKVHQKPMVVHQKVHWKPL